MPDVEMLIHQLNRAKRFAASMTNDAERGRFEALAAEFQRDLDRVMERLANRTANG